MGHGLSLLDLDLTAFNCRRERNFVNDLFDGHAIRQTLDGFENKVFGRHNGHFTEPETYSQATIANGFGGTIDSLWRRLQKQVIHLSVIDTEIF